MNDWLNGDCAVNPTECKQLLAARSKQLDSRQLLDIKVNLVFFFAGVYILAISQGRI